MTPLCFVYRPISITGALHYVTVLGQFTHHFTGETFYRVRVESSLGTANETIYSEAYMQMALSHRVEET